MSRPRLACACLLVTAGLAGAADATAQQPSTTRASVSSSGAEANNHSLASHVSRDGRYVVFESSATTLVANDTNGSPDIFLRDRVTGVTRRLSVRPDGVQGNSYSVSPSMSEDGRLVVFRSGATNLVPGAPVDALLLADTITGQLRQAVVTPATHRIPFDPQISGDGSQLAWSANRFAAGSTTDVFTADVAGGTVRRISQTGAGADSNADSSEPDLSGDGRWLAFRTSATNLVTPDNNGFRDVIVADTRTGAMERASVGSGTPGAEPNLHSSDPALSRDGCIIVFRSDASNLVTPDQGAGKTEIFARNRCTAQTEVVSVTNAGAAASGLTPDISDDGCLVVYLSDTASPPPGAGAQAAVLRDRCAGVTSRLDLATSGEPGNGMVNGLRISGGTGRYVAFTSAATNLVPGDIASKDDTFVRDRAVNTRPVAELALTQSGRRVTADALASRDPDGPPPTGRIAWGDGAPDAAGLQAEHEYARAGSYAVTVTVTDADGATTSRSGVVEIPEAPGTGSPPPGGSGGGGGGASGGGAGGSSVPPRLDPPGAGALPALILDRVSLSRTRFGLVARGKRPAGKRGATLSLRLSAPATVTLRFERARRGRRAGSRCVTNRRRGRRCTTYTVAGTLTTRALGAGTQAIALTGRIGKRTLARGGHRLVVSARTADGRRSTSRIVKLTITSGR